MKVAFDPRPSAWLIAGLFGLLFTNPAFAGPALRVAVGVPVLHTFVERIAGERVETLILQGSGDPHAFEPSARQMAALAGVQMYILAGLPFESAWLPRLESINPTMQVVDLRAGLPARPSEDLASTDQRSSGAPDPHIWTDPASAMKMVDLIRDRLVESDPDGAAVYRAGSRDLNRDLQALETDITAQLSPQRGVSSSCFTPAGVSCRPSRPAPASARGIRPGTWAAQLRDTLATARRSGVSAVFLQPGHGDRMAAQVARELGVPLVLVDPLAADYFGNVRRLVQALASSPP